MKERFQLRPGLYSHFKIICIAFSFPVNLYLGEACLLCLRYFPCLLRCQCELCNDMNLVGALEFRCCREVVHSSGKLVFDGSIERISCITQHEDYAALSNRTVLLQAAPLLRNKDGRSYRRRSGVPENEREIILIPDILLFSPVQALLFLQTSNFC